MKLTYNEIITLIDYYENLVSQLESRMNDLEKINTIVLDFDLYETQRTRYKHNIDEGKARIKELHNELNNL
jgi:hypothetical protein